MQDRAIELDRRPGRIEVAPAALASATVRAVRGCNGVVGIADRKLRHGKAQLLDDKHTHRGVSVAFHGETVAVEIFVVLEYGVRISTVAGTIVEHVHAALAQMLGTTPVRVIVHVQGLHIVG